MSSVFLQGFSEAAVAQLISDGLLEVERGHQADVAAFVAAGLAVSRDGESLISAIARHLIDCPFVIDLYAENKEIKQIINSLPASVLPHPGAER